jgi:hypothetical protein
LVAEVLLARGGGVVGGGWSRHGGARRSRGGGWIGIFFFSPRSRSIWLSLWNLGHRFSSAVFCGERIQISSGFIFIYFGSTGLERRGHRVRVWCW